MKPDDIREYASDVLQLPQGQRVYVDLSPTSGPTAEAPAERPDRPDEYVVVEGVTKVRCGGCGVVYGIGDSPVCRGGHGRVRPGYGAGFEPYFDIGLGRYVTGHGDINKACRELHAYPVDPPSPGQTSVRADKIRERKRREAQRG